MILCITGIIGDFSALAELAEGRPHLQFLQHPDEFDNSQVDFSNYMWEIFARHEQFMRCSIAHKDAVVQKSLNGYISTTHLRQRKESFKGFCLMGTKFGRCKHSLKI